jgi:hypothetical protein
MCFTYVSLFFNIFSEHINAFGRSWHESKTSAAIDIGLQHSQQLCSSHFHRHIIVELVTFQVLPHVPRIISCSLAEYTSVFGAQGRLALCTIF